MADNDERAIAAAELIDEHMFDGRNHHGYDRCDCGWVGRGPGAWPDHLADVLETAGLLVGPEQHAERLDRALWLWAEEKWRREQLLAQRQQWWDTVGREKAALTEQRDLAVWLHAEAVYFGHGWHDQWMVTRKTAHERQARIDAVLAHLETRTHALASDLVYANERDTIRFVRAALAGDQPTALIAVFLLSTLQTWEPR